MDNTGLRTGSRRHVIAVIDGPNMSNLGARNKRVYGKINSLDDLQQYVTRTGEKLGVDIETFASNYEGAILEFIHESAERVSGYIINPAGLTVVGEAVRHALEETGKPSVEVHFANVMAPPTAPRGLPGGPWESRFTKTATGLCMGLRQYSYIGALTALVLSLDDEDFLGAQ
jgi:3-dehydroquinate dehydratase-2